MSTKRATYTAWVEGLEDEVADGVVFKTTTARRAAYKLLKDRFDEEKIEEIVAIRCPDKSVRLFRVQTTLRWHYKVEEWQR